jgi:hypothetical protein
VLSDSDHLDEVFTDAAKLNKEMLYVLSEDEQECHFNHNLEDPVGRAAKDPVQEREYCEAGQNEGQPVQQPALVGWAATESAVQRDDVPEGGVQQEENQHGEVLQHF